MKIKTVELKGAALDWAVAKCVQAAVEIGKRGQIVFDTHEDDVPAGVNEYNDNRWQIYTPSTDWAQGGPIIEREGISWHCGNMSSWHAYAYGSAENFTGPTPLIAAMRCYLSSRLGDEVDVPEELT